MIRADAAFCKALALVCSAHVNRLAAETYGGKVGRVLAHLADERSKLAMETVCGGLAAPAKQS